MLRSAPAPVAGILLVNLGTPAAPSPAAVRRYLRQFLADPRVVDLPRAVWLPLLYGLVLPFRPRRLATAYASIWTADGSPLLAISRRQCSALEERLGRTSHAPRVALGMRYGEPSIEQAICELEAAGVTRIIVLPLYPQYSVSTTAAAYDAIFANLSRRWRVPAVHTIAGYHLEAAYIEALAASVRAHWSALGRRNRLLMSFHGIPERYVRKGDPYAEQCQATAAGLAKALELRADDWALGFQSRFGKAAWLQPYTDHTLRAWAAEGVQEVDVICPGFAADCLETLEEIAQRNARDFRSAGGQALHYIPCLNDAPAHIEVLAGLCLRALEAG